MPLSFKKFLALHVSLPLAIIIVVIILTIRHCFYSQSYTVGVYYYPWYYYDFHGGQYLREKLVPKQIPVLGEYNDRDENVITNHLKWSAYAGVDFWVTSWWGPNSREDETIRNHILKNPNLKNLKIALLYETTGRTIDFSTYANISPDIEYIAENYFQHLNYLRIDGKPVLVVYLTRVLSLKGTLGITIARMRNAAAAKGYQLFIIGDEVWGNPPLATSNLTLLDGITNYDVYGNLGASNYANESAVIEYYNKQSTWRNAAQDLNIAFIPSVTPGFNDRGVRNEHLPLSRRLTEESESGSLFWMMLHTQKELVDKRVKRMIMVTSWNEWHEDTQIEPVAPAPPTTIDVSGDEAFYTNGLSYEGYGMLYLQILRQELSR